MSQITDAQRAWVAAQTAAGAATRAARAAQRAAPAAASAEPADETAGVAAMFAAADKDPLAEAAKDAFSATVDNLKVRWLAAANVFAKWVKEPVAALLAEDVPRLRAAGLAISAKLVAARKRVKDDDGATTKADWENAESALTAEIRELITDLEGKAEIIADAKKKLDAQAARMVEIHAHYAAMPDGSQRVPPSGPPPSGGHPPPPWKFYRDAVLQDKALKANMATFIAANAELALKVRLINSPTVKGTVAYIDKKINRVVPVTLELDLADIRWSTFASEVGQSWRNYVNSGYDKALRGPNKPRTYTAPESVLETLAAKGKVVIDGGCYTISGSLTSGLSLKRPIPTEHQEGHIKSFIFHL